MATVTLRPDGDVLTDWTPVGAGSHYLEVDEVTPDEDTTYIYTGSAGDWDGYSLSTSGLTTETINKVTIYVRVRKTTADAVRVRCGVRIGAGNYLGGQIYPTTSYADASDERLVNPKTGLAWTIAEVEALIGIIYSAQVAGGEARCTQLWAVVDYTAGSNIPPSSIVTLIASRSFL